MASPVRGGERTFPFTPRSARELRIGDIISVPVGEAWGCLQVADVLESVQVRGRISSRLSSHMTAGEPYGRDGSGTPILQQGLTRVEMFTEGRLEVVGNCAVTPNAYP